MVLSYRPPIACDADVRHRAFRTANRGRRCRDFRALSSRLAPDVARLAETNLLKLYSNFNYIKATLLM
jgi:hypothetical protein